MKKLFFLFNLFLFTAFFVGCSSDDHDSSDWNKPKLVLSADTITFQGIESKQLLISTENTDKCAYEIISYPDWIDVSSSMGIISKNEIVKLNLSSKDKFKTPGVYTSELVVFSSLGKDTVYLKQFVGENLMYELPDSIYISLSDKSGILPIHNTGNVDISYTIKASNDYVSLSSNQGSILAGSSANVKLSINRNLLDTGDYFTTLDVSLNDKKETIIVSIKNIKEKKIILKSNIIDAQFSIVRNKLIYVNSDPSSLTIYDVITKTSESIDLNYLPTCLSISSDGNYAVVGHDGKISYVNLINKKITAVIEVPCTSYSVALSNNHKWAYVTPERDQWVHLYSINLENKSVYEGSYSIYEKTDIKLHPSGKYLYAKNYNSLFKFDVQNGKAEYLYDSQESDYSYRSRNLITFTEDGLRFFTNTGYVYKASEAKSQDMVYNGRIKNSEFKGLAHSGIKNNLYAIGKSLDSSYGSSVNNYVSVYNADNLILKKDIELEKYVVFDNKENPLYDSRPEFIFTNKDGSKVYVLANSPDSGLKYNWSLQEVNIDK